MDSETKGWCFFVACIVIVLVTLMACITYYNLEDDKMMIRLAEMGVSPAVVRCVDSSWDSIATHAICSKVLLNHTMTREQAEKLVEGLK